VGDQLKLDLIGDPHCDNADTELLERFPPEKARCPMGRAVANANPAPPKVA
jgi:hypothetical protein